MYIMNKSKHDMIHSVCMLCITDLFNAVYIEKKYGKAHG